MSNPYSISAGTGDGVDDDYVMLGELDFWDSDDFGMVEERRPIFSLLHTCRTSRTVALEKYRLDLLSTIPEENTPLWGPDDIVYFPPPKIRQENSAMLFWLSQERGASPPSLCSLQHVAIQVDEQLATRLPLHEHVYRFTAKLENSWLHNFPAMKSFTLLIDTCLLIRREDLTGADDGRILLFEPENVPISRIGSLTASQIKQIILDMFGHLTPEGTGLPWVDVFVAGMRRPKKVNRIEE